MSDDNLPSSAANDAGKYVLSAGRIARRVTTKDGTVSLPLCNFSARIRDEVAHDDGEQVERVLTIEGATADGTPLPVARVDAMHFPAMRWVASHWGARAIIDAGQGAQDHLRAAIQVLSPDVASRRVYTHTGWRVVDGQSVFLTANGAAGAPQLVVDLPHEMDRYRLPHAPSDPCAAMQASLRLLSVAPPEVTVPLWASMYLAPLAGLVPPKFTLWLYGMTGSLKSTLAALAISHYGDWSPEHLVMWSATANALEKYLFLAKDVPFVVDDYAPQRDRESGGRQESVVERLVRDAGNRAGRARMDGDLSLHRVYRPRGLLLSTGEQLPAIQSLLARLLMVEVRRDAVHLAALTAAQAERSLYPHAMSAYIAWLAPQLDELRASLPPALDRYRKAARAEGQQHLRLPETLATLNIAWELAWRFALEIGAADAGAVEHWRAEGWRVLLAIGRSQQERMLEVRPVERFLGILGEMLARRKAFLLDDSGEGAGAAGPCLGWQNDDRILLLPSIAYHAVVQNARAQGHSFNATDHQIRKALAEDGLTECDPGRLTRTIRVGGVPQRLLKLRRAAVAPYLNSH